MKVVAFNGSPRRKGNTFTLLRTVLDVLEGEGIETELVQLGGKPIRGCLSCYKCFANLDCQCAQQKDALNDWIALVREADGVLLGSPTYFCNVSVEMKAFIDRAGLVAKANGDIFKRKVGAAVVAARRAGAIPTFDAINHFFTISQMIVPGSSYWNLGIGKNEGDVEGDEEGVKTMQTLGENMAWLLGKLHA